MDQSNISFLLQQIINLLTKGGPESKDWRSYGGIDLSKPYSANSMVVQGITNLFSSFLGPLGGVLGGLVSSLVVDSDTNKLGGIDSPSAMLLRTRGGTYGGSFQSLVYNSILNNLKSQRDLNQKQLDRLFYQKYLQVTDPRASDPQYRAKAIYNFQNTRLSLPAALSAILDPMNQNQILQGMKTAEAGGAIWATRQNPLNTGAIYKRAQAFSEATMRMAIQAQTVNQNTPTKQRYGGFSSGAVAQLAGIIANSSNELNYAGDIKTAVARLKDKVRDFTNAMYPLRDIFQQDVKAMVNALQATSGISISQMSTQQIRRLSNGFVDMSRYSGMTPATMQQLGSNISNLIATNNGSELQQLAGRSLGPIAAGLLTQGNNAFGISLERYQADTQNALASALGSQGSQLLSMAYGLYADKNKKANTDTFNSRIRVLRQQGKTALQAAMEVAGVNSIDQLYRGRQYKGYFDYTQTGAAAGVALQQQFRAQLDDFRQRALQQENVEYTAQDVFKAYEALNNMSGAQLKALFHNPDQFLNNNKNVPKNFDKVIRTQLANRNSRLARLGQRAGTARQLDQYAKTQAQIRAAFSDVQTGSPSTAWQTFFQMVTKGTWTETDEGIDIGNNKKVTRSSLLAITNSLLGLTDSQFDIKKTSEAFQNLSKVLGKDTSRILSMAYLGGGKNDRKLKEALKNISQGKVKQADIDYINEQKAIGGNRPLTELVTKLNQKDFVTQSQKKMITDARSEYLSIQNDTTKTEEEKKKARQWYRQRLIQIDTLVLARKQGEQIIGNKGKAQKFTKLYNMQIEGKLTDDLFQAEGISRSDYQSMRNQISFHRDNRMDDMKLLNNTLQQILNWLREHGKRQ